MTGIDVTLVAGFLILMFLACRHSDSSHRSSEGHHEHRKSLGVVQANLTIVAIIDMPIFVIAIVYGLLWRRTNWQGAVGGLVIGSLAGWWCFAFFKGNPDLSEYGFLTALFGEQADWSKWAKSLAAIASALAALVSTPLVTLLFRRQTTTPAMQRICKAFASSETEDSDGTSFELVPVSVRGKMSLVLLLIGFVVFLAGVMSATVGVGAASEAAVGGMLIFFAGGLLRVYND